MSANNNREGDEKVLGMTEDQAIDEAWSKGHRQGLIEGRKMMLAEVENEAANRTPAPHATPADITMLWEAIDGLKARIAELEERRPSPIFHGVAEILEDGTIRRVQVPE